MSFWLFFERCNDFKYNDLYPSHSFVWSNFLCMTQTLPRACRPFVQMLFWKIDKNIIWCEINPAACYLCWLINFSSLMKMLPFSFRSFEDMRRIVDRFASIYIVDTSSFGVMQFSFLLNEANIKTLCLWHNIFVSYL